MRALVVEDDVKLAALLLARLRALGRRGAVERPAVLEVGSLRLDPATLQVWRWERELTLSTKEFALLETFMRRPGQVLSRYDLLDAWDYSYENRSNVVEVYVRYLREKIDRPFGERSLETIRGADIACGGRRRSDEPASDPSAAHPCVHGRDGACPGRDELRAVRPAGVDARRGDRRRPRSPHSRARPSAGAWRPAPGGDRRRRRALRPGARRPGSGAGLDAGIPPRAGAHAFPNTRAPVRARSGSSSTRFPARKGMRACSRLPWTRSSSSASRSRSETRRSAACWASSRSSSPWRSCWRHCSPTSLRRRRYVLSRRCEPRQRSSLQPSRGGDYRCPKPRTRSRGSARR